MLSLAMAVAIGSPPEQGVAPAVIDSASRGNLSLCLAAPQGRPYTPPLPVPAKCTPVQKPMHTAVAEVVQTPRGVAPVAKAAAKAAVKACAKRTAAKSKPCARVAKRTAAKSKPRAKAKVVRVAKKSRPRNPRPASERAQAGKLSMAVRYIASRFYKRTLLLRRREGKDESVCRDDARRAYTESAKEAARLGYKSEDGPGKGIVQLSWLSFQDGSAAPVSADNVKPRYRLKTKSKAPA